MNKGDALAMALRCPCLCGEEYAHHETVDSQNHVVMDGWVGRGAWRMMVPSPLVGPESGEVMDRASMIA